VYWGMYLFLVVALQEKNKKYVWMNGMACECSARGDAQGCQWSVPHHATSKILHHASRNRPIFKCPFCTKCFFLGGDSYYHCKPTMQVKRNIIVYLSLCLLFCAQLGNCTGKGKILFINIFLVDKIHNTT